MGADYYKIAISWISYFTSQMDHRTNSHLVKPQSKQGLRTTL
jgi:hypothetical protein